MASPSPKRLVIKEEAPSMLNDQQWTFYISVFLDNRLLHERLPLKDPLSSDEHEKIRKAFELPGSEENPQELASQASALSHKYCRGLYEQLRLPKYPNGGVLSIEIRPYDQDCGSKPGAPNLDTFQWEHLEEPRLWNNSWSRVVVKRASSLPPPTFSRVSNQNWKYKLSGHNAGHDINILLVVARRSPHTRKGLHHDVHPGLAQAALERARHLNRQYWNHKNIKIDILTQCTFERLETHLRVKTKEMGFGYYQIVHLDLHGSVNKKDRRAYLKFTDDGKTTDLKAHNADNVGELLSKNGVEMVVTNGCDTAVAIHGKAANLGRIFATNGIADVLAMSQKFSTYAARIFLLTFYEELLVQQMPFPEAAAAGRKALRDSPKRYNRHDQPFDLLDCVAPISYSNGASAFVPTVKDRLWKLLFGLLQIFLSILRLSMLLFSYWACNRTMEENSTDVLVLDVETMQLELDLLQENMIYMHGSQRACNITYLTLLKRHWLTYKIFDTVKIIDAKTFLFHPTPSVGSYNELPLLIKKAPSNDLRTIVIIINAIDLLLQPSLPEQSSLGQNRFREFIRQLKTSTQHKTQRLYLILVGSESIDWWKKHFADKHTDFLLPLTQHPRNEPAEVISCVNGSIMKIQQ